MTSLTRYDAQRNVFKQSNAHTVGVLKLLKNYYPALEKKVLEGNPLVIAMVKNNMCNMDILNYPICGHCETLALFTKYAITNKDRIVEVCQCPKCNAETIGPLTVLEFCLMELRKRAPMTIEEDLVGATDAIAERFVKKANWILRKTIKEKIHG
jgi:hypothetical protein